MMQGKVGHFTPDGSIDIALPLGFIPNFFLMDEVGEATNPNLCIFFKQQEDDATGDQAGQYTTGSSGVRTKLGDGAGIAAYESKSQSPTVTEYADVGAPTAKTSTAAGTYTRPSVGNAQDRGSIYECVTSTGAIATEPTWTSIDGGQVTDDSSNVWEKVNVSMQTIGYQGVLIDAAILTDSEEMYYLALQTNQDVDHGDTDGWSSGVDQNA